jgi:hypothetical protein
MSKVLQVRDVPDEVHDKLTREAAVEGLSLNQYMLRELRQLARRADNSEILHRAARRLGRRLSSAEIVASVREDRERTE